VTPEQALLHEFDTQYLPDEMPALSQRFVREVLPRWANASAQRIVHATSGNIDGACKLLNSIRADRRHPFIQRLNDATGMEWDAEDEEWNVLVALLGYMIDGLQAIREGRAKPGLRAFEYREGGRLYYVLEDDRTRTEVLRVDEPTTIEGALVVTYESIDPKQTPERAWKSIFEVLIRSFLHDRYRGQVDQVTYVHADSGLSISVPYE
jgi:hypothetical protein